MQNTELKHEFGFLFIGVNTNLVIVMGEDKPFSVRFALKSDEI